MPPRHILSVGKDPTLMSSRTLLLLNSGYSVHEAHTLEKAKGLVHSDLIEVVLLCHTLSEREKRILISLVREKRNLMPVLCIQSSVHESVPHDCTAVSNEPETLLQGLKLAVQSASRATRGGPSVNPPPQ